MTLSKPFVLFGGGGAVVAVALWMNRNKGPAIAAIEPTVRPDGGPKSWTTTLLALGSKMMQSNSPLKDTDIYLVGFHPMKYDPCHQMEAHHYCKQVNEDFAQCLIYDGNTSNANLTGVEYIISDKIFDKLPSSEQEYWHPHNYEIFSGQLIAKGLPSMAEKLLMQTKVNSYGKTIHTWRAKCWEGDKPFQDTLPLGPPILGWSFNHEGEPKHDIVETRDKKMNVDTLNIRKDRLSLVPYAKPQAGVNYISSKMKEKTGGEAKTTPCPGVMDRDDLGKRR
jgi:hypothetical protein